VNCAKLFSCERCEEKFQLWKGLRTHKCSKVPEPGPEMKPCSICSVLFELSEIEEHEERHRSREFPFSCLICEDKKFLRSSQLSQHMKEKHPSERDIKKCQHCESVFVSTKKLRSHIITEHEDAANLHRCTICDAVYFRQIQLKVHMDNKHSSNNDAEKQLWICETCGKSFKDQSRLTRHQLWHSESRPFKCKLCDRCFQTQASVTKHEETHAGLQFQCPDCPKTFSTDRYLKQHSRCHLPFELRKYYHKTKASAEK